MRLLVWMAISIALMMFDNRTTMVDQVRTALSIPLTPLQYLVSTPIKWVDKLREMVSSRDALVKENLDLKAEQLLLKAQVQRLLAIESENTQLKALFRSSARIKGKMLVTQLLAVDTEPFVAQMVVDRGSRDGVFIGQPVLDANGVMGQVIQVTPMTSRVLLVNDPHSGVPVQNARNGIRAIAVGDNNTGKMRLVNIPKTVDIQQGDMLVTSGLGERYPEGYPVGQVISVTKDPGLQFATIIVEPSAHLDQSREVLLIWPAKS